MADASAAPPRKGRTDDCRKPLVPVVAGAKSLRPPYAIINAPDGPYTTDLPGNTCTECHRAQCTTLFDGEGEGDDEGEPSSGYQLDELAMPAPFHDLTTWDDAAAAADRQAVRDWCNSLDPFGPQYDFGDDDEEGGTDADDGPCDAAYDCALACGAADYDCARACGSTHLVGASASTFDALLRCGRRGLPGGRSRVPRRLVWRGLRPSSRPAGRRRCLPPPPPSCWPSCSGLWWSQGPGPRTRRPAPTGSYPTPTRRRSPPPPAAPPPCPDLRAVPGRSRP